MLLVDGLGHELLARHRDHAPYLPALMAGSAPGHGRRTDDDRDLADLARHCADVPGTHGVVGFTSRIPGTDQLLNALYWDKDVDPLEWQPHPTAFERLAAAGVLTTTVNKREFAGSGLTVASQRGAELHRRRHDRRAHRGAVVGSARGSPSVTYVYDGDLDWTGHRYGVDSRAWRPQLDGDRRGGRASARGLAASATRLLVVADHGMVDSRRSSRFEVDDDARLRDGVALIGARRASATSTAAAARSRTSRPPGARSSATGAMVLTRDEAIARGWFGTSTPGAPASRRRRRRLPGDTAIMSARRTSRSRTC